MSHKPMLAPPPQRHSMEISGPVLISSSNPTAAARIGEISGGLSCSAPSQVKSERELEQHIKPSRFSNAHALQKTANFHLLHSFFMHFARIGVLHRFIMNERISSLIIMSPSSIYGSCSYASTGISITAKSSIPVLLYNVDDICCYLPQPWKSQSQNPMKKKSVFKPVFVHKKFPSLCQQLDWLSHPLHHHTKQTIAPSKRLKSRMHDSTRLLKWVLLSPWGFPHQPQH